MLGTVALSPKISLSLFELYSLEYAVKGGGTIALVGHKYGVNNDQVTIEHFTAISWHDTQINACLESQQFNQAQTKGLSQEVFILKENCLHKRHIVTDNKRIKIDGKIISIFCYSNKRVRWIRDVTVYYFGFSKGGGIYHKGPSNFTPPHNWILTLQGEWILQKKSLDQIHNWQTAQAEWLV